MLTFGGHIRQGIDPQWRSHAAIVKTIVDLFSLKSFGVDRVDKARSLADRYDPTVHQKAPPPFGTSIAQPPPPQPPPSPVTPDPWTGPNRQPLPALVTTDGTFLAAPTDGTVRPHPPQLPTEAT